MTQIAIREQVDALKSATADALKSREASIKILRDAGIIQNASADAKQTSQNYSKQVKK